VVSKNWLMYISLLKLVNKRFYIDNTQGPLPPAEQLRIVFSSRQDLLELSPNIFFLPALVQATQQPNYSGQPESVISNLRCSRHSLRRKCRFMKCISSISITSTEAVRIVEKWQQRIWRDTTGAKFLKSRMQDERHSQLNLLVICCCPFNEYPRYRLLLAESGEFDPTPSTDFAAGMIN
jgi:hypothetical protein